MKRLLVTTALKQTWNTHDQFKCVCLGEWCRLYPERDEWKKISAEVLPYHWDDRAKLKQDHDYLKELYERILPVLTKQLNDIHGITESVQYWRIIIGPWLITYLPIVFDRWEMLRLAFEKENTYSTIWIEQNAPLVATNFTKFLGLMQTDLWNFFLYQRIIANQYEHKVASILIDDNLSGIQVKQTGEQSVKQNIINVTDKLMSLFGGEKGILFYNSYFPPAKLAALNLALKQVPRMYVDTFVHTFTDRVDTTVRETYSVNCSSHSSFENFLFHNLFVDIPISYLEGFASIKNTASKIKLKHDVIVTANAYWGDEVFKTWAAGKQKQGKKLIICQHGGSLPPLFDTFQHEEDIADHHITWFKAYHPKHIQLPPNKIIKGKLEKMAEGNCSVIGFESPRFSYRSTAGAISHQVLDFLDHTVKFCELLDDNVKAKLQIRPYPNMGWNTKQRYSDRLSPEVISLHTPFKDFLKNAKLIVCTYPQTTFSESMASGKPTILLYVPKYNELTPETNELLEILISANIVFSDPLLAAQHVNNIWLDIDAWWMSEKVAKAKQAFFDIALRINGDWKQEWVQFLKSL